MREIFLNAENESFFKEHGYIKLPFERALEIENYKAKIYALSPSDNFNAFQKTMLHPQDFHCTFFDSNEDYRKKVFEILTDFFASSCENLLYNYRFIQANVFIKPPYKGYVAPHQNLTVVEETKFTSLSFWCPAQNTNADNGTMVIVPKSHKKFMKYRTTNISWPLLPLFSNYDSPFLETIEVKKGEVLLIDDSLIHGTTNNTTSMERFVFHAMLAPKEAEILYCTVESENNRVNIFRVPDLFWQYYMPGDIPDGLDLWEVRNATEKGLTEEEFRAELYAPAVYK